MNVHYNFMISELYTQSWITKLNKINLIFQMIGTQMRLKKKTDFRNK